MFELICMSLLGAAYISACIEEEHQEKIKKEKERIRDIKIKVFCYSVQHGLQYDETIEMIKTGNLTFNEIFNGNYK